MKRLIALISSAGKSAEQLSKEAWAAYQKYQQVSLQASPSKDDEELTFAQHHKR